MAETARATQTAGMETGTSMPGANHWTERGTATPRNTPDQTAAKADEPRFEQELCENLTPRRADGHTQSDLAGALGYGNEHNVHDSDA